MHGDGASGVYIYAAARVSVVVVQSGKAGSLDYITDRMAGRQAGRQSLSVCLCFFAIYRRSVPVPLPACLCACNEPASNTATAAAAVRKIRLALLTAHYHLMHFNLYFNIPPVKVIVSSVCDVV